jgi:hypothetical protein
MHELGPEPNFNESMYFNCFDAVTRVGGFFRLGNRPNEGTGEMTICLYLPDGRVAFMFRRPRVTTNEAFDAAGLRFEVLEPFTELRVAYEGPVVVLDDPLQMADPRRAFASNPNAACSVDLSYRGLSAMFGGEPDEPVERPGEEFARGHYEQLGTSVLAGALVLPLAHRQRGKRVRLHGVAHRETRRPGDPSRFRVGGRRAAPVQRPSSVHRVGRRGPLPHGDRG